MLLPPRLRPIRVLGLGAVTCAASVGVFTAPAAACSDGPSVVLAAPVVPADGLVNVLWPCGGGCTEALAPDQLEVREMAGGELTTLERIRRGVDARGDVWGVYQPAQPLMPESTYELVIDDPERVVEGVIQVVASGPALDPSTLEIEANLYASGEPAGEEICCGVPVNDSCGAAACFWTKEKRTAQLALTIDTRIAGAGEWLYAVTWSVVGADAITTEPTSVLSSAVHELDVLADEYCYAIEATRIADGEPVIVASGCIANTLDALGERATALEDYASALIECDEPPQGYEQDWCGEVERACGLDSEYRAGICAHRDELCETLARDDGTASEPMADGDTRDDTSAAGAEGSGAGCSVGTRGNPGWAAACLLFAAAWARRRRGQKRAS